MSILIKDMDMPKPGDIIVVARIDGGVQCTIASRHLPVKWREVVNIPTPHGRLIDADALTKALKKRWNVDDDQDFANKSLWRELENAPTIIEAEGNT